MKKLLKKLRLYFKEKTLDDLQRELVKYEDIYRKIYKTTGTTQGEIQAIFTLINDVKLKIAKIVLEISTLYKEVRGDDNDTLSR